MVYGGTRSEKMSKAYKRSIYIAEDVEIGDIFTEKNLRIVRPGGGLEPKYYENFLGRKASKSAKKGTAADWNMLGDKG